MRYYGQPGLAKGLAVGEGHEGKPGVVAAGRLQAENERKINY